MDSCKFLFLKILIPANSDSGSLHPVNYSDKIKKTTPSCDLNRGVDRI